MMRDCKECGTPIVLKTTVGRPKEYCSFKCRIRASNRRLRPPSRKKKRHRNCKWCGVPIPGRTRRREYCNAQCKSAFNNNKKNTRAKHEHAYKRRVVSCYCCGRGFLKTRKSHIFCSRKCGKKFNDRRNEVMRRQAMERAAQDARLFY